MEDFRKDVLESWNDEVLRVVENIEQVIVGKRPVLRLLLASLIAGGHCLLEDVPGVGKTLMVKALARSIDCAFKRIQFTPDLLPSDVTGTSIYNQRTGEFEFRPGPVFGQIILADEINRTSPKTQSALLQAMEEGAVSVDGETHDLSDLFFVLATENPVEFEGTYPLPEAQLDRFLLKISVGYPSYAEELLILDKHGSRQVADTNLRAVATVSDVLRWRQAASKVAVVDSLREYIVQLVQATREAGEFALGASPRASLALYRAAQALAFVSGRDYVVPDDIRLLVPHVFLHRLLLSPAARFSGTDATAVLDAIMRSVPVPPMRG